MSKHKKQPFTDESSQIQKKVEHSDQISIKIKKSDNKIIKMKVNIQTETVKNVKEKAFIKEREENKNIRLIYQGKILQDNEKLAEYSKHSMNFTFT